MNHQGRFVLKIATQFYIHKFKYEKNGDQKTPTKQGKNLIIKLYRLRNNELYTLKWQNTRQKCIYSALTPQQNPPKNWFTN